MRSTVESGSASPRSGVILTSFTAFHLRLFLPFRAGRCSIYCTRSYMYHTVLTRVLVQASCRSTTRDLLCRRRDAVVLRGSTQGLAGVADDVDARPLEHHRRFPTLAVAPTSLDHMCHARSGECCSSGRSIAAAGQWAALVSSGRLRHRLRHRQPPPTRWPRGSTRYPRASRWLSASST